MPLLSPTLRWLLSCTVLWCAVAYAQTASPTLVHQLQLPVGSVLEVMPVGTQPTDTYVWSLSRGDFFLQAGRNRLFRTRLIEQGAYLLSAEIRDPNGELRYRKEFQIQITDVAAEAPDPDQSNSGSLLIRSDPPRNRNGATVAAPNVDIVTLTPQKQTDKLLILDTKPQLDSDGDGDTRNDQEVPDSFFATEQTPLVLWFPDRSAVTSLAIAIEGDTGSTEILRIITQEESEQELQEKQGIRIDAVTVGSGAVRFSLAGDTLVLGDTEALLYQWDFGDGSQSLLGLPIHNYEQNGSYTVALDVRNLQTGSIAESFTATVQVSTVPYREPPPPAENGEAPVEDDSAADAPAWWASGWDVLKLVIGLVVAAVLGFLLIMLVRVFKAKGGVRSALEKAESTLVSTKEEEVTKEKKVAERDIVDVPATPLAVEEEEEMEQPLPEEPNMSQEPIPEEQEEPPPPPTPPIQDAQAPDWLRKGIEEASVSGQTMVTPPTEALADEQSAPPQQTQTAALIPDTAPAPQTPQEQATQQGVAPLPPWLQESTPSQLKPTSPAPTPTLTTTPSALPTTPKTAVPAAAASTPQAQTPITPEEKERAKKREKRLRYRRNKKEREQSARTQQEKPAQDDEVKFVIGADSVAKQRQSPPPEEHHADEAEQKQ